MRILGENGRGVRLRFVLVSGLGWLIDTGVYTILVALGLRVLVASILGGLCGATFAFLTSSRFIFVGAGDHLSLKLVAYLLYSAVLILVAAWLVESITTILVDWAERWRAGVPLTPIAFIAKCLITPFLLATNFVVARAMLQLTVPSRHG